jgi:hypothetical protein
MPKKTTRVKRIFSGLEKFVAGKCQILSKSGRKEANKSFIDNDITCRESPPFYTMKSTTIFSNFNIIL